jgi:3-isopropylmalate dehydrogenase
LAPLIVLLPGDGIGPEVSSAAQAVLVAVGEVFGRSLRFEVHEIGGAAIDACGEPLPEKTLAACQGADAVLLGAVGGPRWSDPGLSVRPEQGLLRLRQGMGVFANLRPVVPHPRLLAASPIRPELLTEVDICFVRELTGGLYFGDKTRDGDSARDVCTYTVDEIERVVRLAARLARQRRGRLTSVDKANVLETSRLWRETTERIVRDEFPDIELEHALVDSAAMRILQIPRHFDVIVTENLFGDILTDEASVLAGSIGVLPSASLSESGAGLYEPIHGSAPDLMGQGVANPVGAILSAAMLLRHSLGMSREAEAVEAAVSETLGAGVATPDIAHEAGTTTSTSAVTSAVIRALKGESAALAAS